MDTKQRKLALILVAIILLLTACRGFTERLAPKATPTEPVEGIGRTKVNPIDGMVLVYVPAGEFLMGSEDEEARPKEKPEHLVYLDAFWIYQTEVTNQQYRQCIEAGVCSSLRDVYPDDDHPVTFVFRRHGHKYCQWAGGRLPTEAEWEKAARGTDGRKYPWGDEPVTAERANFCDVNCDMDWKNQDTSEDDGYAQTAPVGSYPAGASPYGALDMAGNAWEWVSDDYDPDYYTTSPYRNPTGSKDGYAEIARGGSWLDNPQQLRTTFRLSLEESLFDDNVLDSYGFRCVHPDE